MPETKTSAHERRRAAREAATPAGRGEGGAPSRVHDRFTFAPGVIGWVFRYTNRQPVVRRDAISGGLELSTQLAGSWSVSSEHGGRRAVGPSSAFAFSPAERYGFSYCAAGGAGLQVGFLLYPDEVPRFAGFDGALQIVPRAVEGGGRLVRLCRDVAREAERGGPVAAMGGVLSELLAIYERFVEPVARDPLWRAERELVDHFDRPLYVQHLAEIAGMSRDSFSRQFARRFGMGPTRYRLMRRLERVGRLVWSRPELTLPEIGTLTGFDDLSYLHRSFRAHYGVSPVRYGQRHPDGAETSAP